MHIPAQRSRWARLGMLALSAATAAACASTGAVPRPFPTPDRPARGTAPPPAAPTPGAAASSATALDGQAIAATALSLQGIPYRLGGASTVGFDCSGLVQYVLGRHGVSAPRIVRDQFQLGREVRGELQPGDLVFFGVGSRRATHVGIAIDSGRFVHAPATGHSVRIDSLDAAYWRDRYAGSRRVTDAESPAVEPSSR